MDIILAATSITPERSVAFTLTVIIAGLGTVLVTLALLILIFNVFGKGLSLVQKRKNKSAPVIEEQKEEIKKGVPLPPPIEAAEGVPPEVVAAISAAVYMLDGGNAEITSIRKKKAPLKADSVWARAAVRDNTRPF
ncbi:MAG: OadG family protein [Eubacterium sp.]|nr:OadG family protein [Eubacterium sp.]